jgi:hypothetical protein
MQTQSKHENDYHSIDVILFILITLATLFLQFILELWHFIQSPKKSLSPLGTPLSHQKKDLSSSRQTSLTPLKTSSVETVAPTPKTGRSTATRRMSSNSTGSPSTPKRNLKAGTKSQATRTSKSGLSTQSASHQETTR